MSLLDKVLAAIDSMDDEDADEALALLVNLQEAETPDED